MKKKLSSTAKNNITGLVFALPWIIGFIAFSVYPLLSSMYYSFTEFNPIKTPEWVGMSNYNELFKDPLFYQSLKNTLFYTFMAAIVNVTMALLLAVLIKRDFKGKTFFRAVFFIPSIIPMVAGTMIWI